MKIYQANAKVNIFLKITGIRDNYHTLASRFMIVENLYDQLWFEEKPFSKQFIIDGMFDCTTEQNTIYKAYKALLESLNDPKIKEFFYTHKVVVKKAIPAFAGLGGGSSDAATFLAMLNERLDLSLEKEQLATIGLKVGADVPFFVYGYKSANVSGIGEIVEEFQEESFLVETITPPVKISTPAVYKKYRSDYFAPITKEQEQHLFLTSSKEILQQMSLEEANDLFAPALALYPQLQQYKKAGWFFSGSGSSFFKKL